MPPGFSRVYVHLPSQFDYQAWFHGLDAGHSFVTTGPMLATAEPGHVFGTVLSETPITSIEIIINGVVHQLPLNPLRTPERAWEAPFLLPLQLDGTSWVAVRCFEPRPAGRFRFAHTAPQWFDQPGQPPRPRAEEIAFLIRRVRDELNRSRDTLPPEAIAEYEQALAIYQEIALRAR